MHSTLLAILASSLLLPAPGAARLDSPAQEAPQADLASLYQGLAEEGDFDGLVELWKKNQGRVLSTIDRDLESSLSLWESIQGESEDEQPVPKGAKEAIDALHQRALFGARAASVAFDRPIFLDYAASFVGWNSREKRVFRAGQQAFGASGAALRDKDTQQALAQAQRCSELALGLGDWWGAAMGLGASGRALIAMGQFENALRDLSQARLLNHGLGLKQAEAHSLTGMLDCLEKLEHWQRALAVCDHLMTMLGDAGNDMFGERRAAIETHLTK